MDRREFLEAAGAVASAGILVGVSACEDTSARPEGWTPRPPEGHWGEIRSRFALDPKRVQLAGLLLAPHPEPVRRAIEEHRRALDATPAEYVEANDGRLKRASRDAAARHMGVDGDDVGLTDSTTMGIGLAYAGLRMQPGQEVLVTDHAYPATLDALELRAARDGITIRQVELEPAPATSPDAVAGRILSGVTDRTRALALTWVHSSTGLKIPVRQIADGLAERNQARPPEDRAMLCLDGVHGLGVEDEDVGDLGCDIFFAGTHKWVFAPRGTGVIWASPGVQGEFAPSLPTFIKDGTWGGRMSPGGFKPFEHQWSMSEAFDFLEEAGGRTAVRDRIHELAARLKEELAAMDGVVVRTPSDPRISAGIVAFDVDGTPPDRVVRRLAEHDIVATAAPYAESHARFSPGLLNTDAEIEHALGAMRTIAG